MRRGEDGQRFGAGGKVFRLRVRPRDVPAETEGAAFAADRQRQVGGRHAVLARRHQRGEGELAHEPEEFARVVLAVVRRCVHGL